MTGELSETIGTDHPNLVTLELGDNEITGTIPASIVGLRSLETLGLSTNELSGEILPGIGLMSDLKVIELHENVLEGSVPDTFYNERIVTLRLGGNDLVGEISPLISKMTSLKRLYLGDSKMEGSIPAGLFQLENVQEIHLQNANFVGEMVAEFANLAPTLIELFLQNNDFYGEIPNAIYSSTKIEKLDISGNPRITGNFRKNSEVCRRQGYNQGDVVLLQFDCHIPCGCCGFRTECDP